MKKLLILIVAFCGIISAHADEPTPAQQAANQANTACSAFGKKAEPSSAENAHGSVTVTTTNGNENGKTSGWNAGGSASGSVGVASGSASGGYERSKNEKENNQSQTSVTLYYQCK